MSRRRTSAEWAELLAAHRAAWEARCAANVARAPLRLTWHQIRGAREDYRAHRKRENYLAAGLRHAIRYERVTLEGSNNV